MWVVDLCASAMMRISTCTCATSPVSWLAALREIYTIIVSLSTDYASALWLVLSMAMWSSQDINTTHTPPEYEITYLKRAQAYLKTIHKSA